MLGTDPSLGISAGASTPYSVSPAEWGGGQYMDCVRNRNIASSHAVYHIQNSAGASTPPQCILLENGGGGGGGGAIFGLCQQQEYSFLSSPSLHAFYHIQKNDIIDHDI